MFKLTKVFYTYTENREKVQLAFEVVNLNTNERTTHTLLEILSYKNSILNGEYIQHVNVHYSGNLVYPMLVLDDPVNNITILPTEPNGLSIEQELITDSLQYMPYFEQTVRDFSNIATNYNLNYNDVAALTTTEVTHSPQPPEILKQNQPTQTIESTQNKDSQTSEVLKQNQDSKMYTPRDDSEPVVSHNTEGKIAKSKGTVVIADIDTLSNNKVVRNDDSTINLTKPTENLTSVVFEEPKSHTESNKIDNIIKSKQEENAIKKEMKVCDILYDTVNIKTDSINDILKIECDLDENFTFITDDYDVLELKLSSIFTEAKKGKYIDYLPKFINREYILPNITFKSFKRMCQIINTFSQGDWLEFLCKFLKANYDNLSNNTLSKAFRLSFGIFSHDLADKYDIKAEEVYKLIEKIIDIDSLTLTKFDSIMKSYNYFSVRVSKTDLKEYHVLFNSEDIIFIDTESNHIYNIKDVLDDTKKECNCQDTYQIDSCLVVKEGKHYIPQGIFIQGEKCVFIPAIINNIDILLEKFNIPREDIENIYIENYNEEIGKYYVLNPKGMRFVLSETCNETNNFDELIENLNDKVCDVFLEGIIDDNLIKLYY